MVRGPVFRKLLQDFILHLTRSCSRRERDVAGHEHVDDKNDDNEEDELTMTKTIMTTTSKKKMMILTTARVFSLVISAPGLRKRWLRNEWQYCRPDIHFTAFLLKPARGSARDKNTPVR